MTQRISFSDTRVNKTIHDEQLNQIIEAILAGKYSWACFLIVDLEHLEIEHKQNTRLRGGVANEPHNLNSAFQWLRKYF